MAVGYRQITLFIFASLLVGFVPLHAQKQQRGKASYYSKRATGARTSSGERVHHDSLTCAHRTFPFGTRLKVTDLSTGQWVVVRVTDRGPFGRGRIVDLSWAAAKELGILARGVAMVEVEPYVDTMVPFRPVAIKYDLPEFDFEITDGQSVDILHPNWGNMKRTKKKPSTR